MVDLKGARIIVAGGGGVGSKENFQLIWDLAGPPSAAPSAPGPEQPSTAGTSTATTRSARPARPFARRCTSPAASAARSSTAPAWRNRARSSRSTPTPDAPIFSVAHYGIVGDLNDCRASPTMIKAVRRNPGLRVPHDIRLH